MRLIASTATTVAATTAITVEPTTAISVMTMGPVFEAPIVAARCPASASSTTTTGAENEAYDQGDHDYCHNYEEHSHPNSPFTGFPRCRLQHTGSTTPL